MNLTLGAGDGGVAQLILHLIRHCVYEPLLCMI